MCYNTLCPFYTIDVMTANNHKFKTITFTWYVKGKGGYYIVYNRSYKDALVFAKTYGFKPFKIYNPRTWKNKVVTENHND